MRKAFKDASIVTFANGTSALLGALAIVVTVRGLSVTEWGVAALIISLGPLISLCLSLGTVTHHVRELARLTSGPVRRNRYMVFLGQRSALTLAVLGISGALYTLESTIPAACLGLASVRFFRGGTTALLTAERRFGGQSVVIVGEKVVTLACAAILVEAQPSVFSLPLAQAGGAAVASAVALVLSGSISLRPLFVGVLSMHRMWEGGGYFGLTSLSTAAQQLDVSLVTALASPYQAGLFAAAARIPSSLNVVGSALALVILPSAADSRISLGRLFARYRALGYVGFGVAVAGAGGVAYAAAWWVPAILGHAYVDAVGVVRIYLVAVLLGIIIQPAVALLQARGDEKYAARLSLLQVISSLLLQGAGAAVAGAFGAAAGYLAAYTVVFGIILHRILVIASEEK